MVKHIILWKLKEEFSEEEKKQIKAGIKEGLDINNQEQNKGKLTHFNEAGEAHMVDVHAKDDTYRARRENVPRHILLWMHVWREARQLPEQVYLGKGLQETEYL